MPTDRGTTRVGVAYVALLLAAVAVFLTIRSYGERLEAPLPQAVTKADQVEAAGSTGSVWRHLLVALTAVIVVGRVVGRAFMLISPTMFTMMVLMALVTTIATTPLLLPEAIDHAVLRADDHSPPGDSWR